MKNKTGSFLSILRNRKEISSLLLSLKQFFSFCSTILGLKHRHFLTRKNRLRVRYVAGCFVFLMAALLTLTLQSHHSNALGPFAYNAIDDAHKMALIEPAIGYQEKGLKNLFNNNGYGQLSLASAMHNIPDELPLDRYIEIKPGDALGVVMEKQGVGNREAAQVISAMKKHYDPRNIKAGQIVHLNFEKNKDRDSTAAQSFQKLQIPLDSIKTLVVARAGDGFASRIDEKKVQKVVKAKRAEIEVSLYGSAAKAGIPKNVVANAIHIYSWNVDFQRDIRPNDKLEVMYESYETEEGYVAKIGDILYAKLTLGGCDIPLYRYEMKDGRVEYFQPDGVSIKRTLMKTPIDGARMSSGFGMRRHPVLGYNKMHKGVDFAAPRGTPIYAAGDGVVERAGRNGGYGNYVRIRHNSKLKTAYAHMNRIRSSVKTGTRVKQGQVIGYVGSTGRSTGPHLHYEVLLKGRQVNPRSVNLPTGEELAGQEKQKFKAVVNKYRQQFVSLYNGNKVASRKSYKKTATN